MDFHQVANVVGLSPERVCLRKGSLFSVNIPNKQALGAMEDAEQGKI